MAIVYSDVTMAGVHNIYIGTTAERNSQSTNLVNDHWVDAQTGRTYLWNGNQWVDLGLTGLMSNYEAFRTVYCVDTVNGASGNDGLSWDTAFATMSAAFAVLASNDVVLVRGNVLEELSTPVQVFDVTIVGVGNKPRHSDAEPAGGTTGSTWRPPASGHVAGTPLITVRQQGWKMLNMLLDGPSDGPAIRLFRDGGAGDLERDASHFTGIGLKIVNGQIGIQNSGGTGQHHFENCEFFGNTTDVADTLGAGIGQPYLRSTFKNCKFRDGTNGIVIPSQQAIIEGCHFDDSYTVKINTSGGVGGNIIGPNNVLGGYPTGYTFGTGDIITGNDVDSDLTIVRTVVGETVVDDSEQDESVAYFTVLTIEPVASAPLKNVRVVFDLDKVTTGHADVNTTETLRFRVARKVDGTNWRGNTNGATTAIAGDNADGVSVEVDVGPVGAVEDVRIEALMSADAAADFELPYVLYYEGVAAPTVTEVAFP